VPATRNNRLAGWVIIAALALALFALLVFLLAAAAVVLSFALFLAALGAMSVVYLVYVPRLSRRLGLSPLALSALLLILSAGVGWLVLGRQTGALWGALVWLCAYAVPGMLVLLLRPQVHLEVSVKGRRGKPSSSKLSAPQRPRP
jgi:hypothetical protein